MSSKQPTHTRVYRHRCQGRQRRPDGRRGFHVQGEEQGGEDTSWRAQRFCQVGTGEIKDCPDLVGIPGCLTLTWGDVDEKSDRFSPSNCAYTPFSYASFFCR